MREKGQSLGNYKLVSLLGRGQSGEVWAALDRDGTLVAVKCFSAAKEADARREYENAARWNHPGLLHPLLFTKEQETPLIVMPYCEGRSIDALAGYFRETQAWKLLAALAASLGHLHEAGYCHSDVKPSNILWDGKNFLLADFGACSPISGKISSDDLSSYQFAAPERQRDPSADIWSVGATLFNMVMGTQVFNGLGGAAQRAHSPIPMMRKEMPELSALVCRCLAWRPQDRPTARELAALASEGLTRYPAAQRLLKAKPITPENNPYASFWPDAMTEPQV